MSVSSLLLLGIAASCVWKAAATTQPSCTDALIPVHATANNHDFSGNNGSFPVVNVSGTFVIQARFCEPTEKRLSRTGTLLVLSPGSTYNTLYWDLPIQPETYSFVRFAAAHGFPTLNLARLGDGESDHPDPTIVQMPLQAALVISILELARAGTLPGAFGRKFHRFVGIGHSLSSGIFNQIINDKPKILEAVVLSGYGHIFSGRPAPVLPGFIPANQVLPERFGKLPDDYLTSQNISVRLMFYGPNGTFDPKIFFFDEAHKDLVATHEFFSFGLANVAATQFRGHVLTVDGEFDTFCTVPDCSNLEIESQFYPNARSTENVAIKS